jgi:hypothetical protein
MAEKLTALEHWDKSFDYWWQGNVGGLLIANCRMPIGSSARESRKLTSEDSSLSYLLL